VQHETNEDEEFNLNGTVFTKLLHNNSGLSGHYVTIFSQKTVVVTLMPVTLIEWQGKENGRGTVVVRATQDNFEVVLEI
jgi:hypothetical protein